MKPIHLILFLALMATMATSLATPVPQTSSTQTDVQGAPCRSKPKLYPDGRIESCTLSRDLAVSGHLLPAGSEVRFSPTGDLSMCRLGRESAMYGQILPAQTRLFFAGEGRLRHFWLPADTLLQGHLVKGQSDGAGNRLHPNGKLLAIWLAQDEEIDGVPCTSSGDILRMGLGVIRLGTQRMAWFYSDGRLQQAMLSRDVTLQGHPFKKGEIVSLSPTGKVDLNAKKLKQW